MKFEMQWDKIHSNALIVKFPPEWRWEAFNESCIAAFRAMQHARGEAHLIFDMSAVNDIPVGLLEALWQMNQKAPMRLERVLVVSTNDTVRASFTMLRRVDSRLGGLFHITPSMQAARDILKEDQVQTDRLPMLALPAPSTSRLA